MANPPPPPASPPPPPKRPRRSRPGRAKEIEKSLQDIYNNPEAKTDDLTTFYRGPGGGRWTLLLGVIFVSLLAVVAWSGFRLFRPAEKFAGENIDFSILAPAELVAGETQEFVINYGNRESVPLGAVEISVAYPKEFKVIEVDPAVPEPNTWKIGSLPKLGEGQIKLRGIINAPKGKSITLQAYLTYKPANFNSDFQKVATLTVPVTKSLLSVSVEGPERAYPGEEIQYIVSYQNNSELSAEGTEIRAFYADNFFPKKAVPAPTEGEGRWELPKLLAGAKGEIKVTGSFSSNAEGARLTAFEAGRVSEEGVWIPMDRATSSVELVKSELKLILVANGSPKGGVLNFGDAIRYSLSFENRSQTALSDITLVMHLEGSPIVGGRSPLLWESLEDEFGGKRVGNTITWTKKEISALERIEPGAQDTVDISIPLMTAPFAKGGKDYKVVAFGEAKIGRIGNVRSARVVRSESLEMRLLTDLTFVSEGRYFNDEDIALGTGPVPPRIGETTAYRIWWTLSNSLHDVEGIKVQTVLPDGVTFTGKFSSGEIGVISYDEKERKVTWLIDKLPGGKIVARAEFEVSITPAEDQLGSSVSLTGLSNLEARDIFLDALIFRTASQITSNIETDPNLAGRGEVRR